MKLIYKSIVFATVTTVLSCKNDDIAGLPPAENPFETEFTKISSIQVSNQGVPEISAYDKVTQQVFSTNTEAKLVEVIDISDVSSPKLAGNIDISIYGKNLNSVAVQNGMLAVAIEGKDKNADEGSIVVFDTKDLTTPIINVKAGFLPDMVTFSPDGTYILSANEGEPNDENTIDPKGSISIITIANKTIKTLDFTAFNSQEANLEEKGFRVFGETNGKINELDVDVEPEYIAVADDSKTAYVALQENNGIAVVDLTTQTITDILPLGTKDFNDLANAYDVSDKDDAFSPANWNVKSFYMPDAIDYFTANGVGYIITANEGDARDYDGFSEEVRVKDLVLDETVYPDAETLQKNENLGRLKVTTANGDADGDGKFEQIFAYGGRSFSIWTTDGSLVYDSGNSLAQKTVELGTYPESRSDDKGTEPEAVVTYTIGNFTYAFVGLERSGNVFVYDISNPTAPVFLQNLPNTSPEGLTVVPAMDSPNGKDLLIVSNEFPDKEFVIEDANGGDFGKLVIFSK
ncbi:choice-of-anchor I family protein [Aquimarina agarilytica]|uniref:choice-of-anchor I family protein n=1 Tax=Aquimarina agarilytica TaxID=1087449 RepID=UPI00028905C0|nr:choice-of-anchor I family protein [Aquimarina agarilytica]